MTPDPAIPAAWCCTRCDLAGRTCDHTRPSLLDAVLEAEDVFIVWHDQGDAA